MVNHKMSECSKLKQKEYKSRHDWVGKAIYWELWKRLKFEFYQTTKWKKHKSESIIENISGILRYKRITYINQTTRPSVNK